MRLYLLYKTLKQAKKGRKNGKNVWECRLRNGRWFIVHTGSRKRNRTTERQQNYRTEQGCVERVSSLVFDN